MRNRLVGWAWMAIAAGVAFSGALAQETGPPSSAGEPSFSQPISANTEIRVEDVEKVIEDITKSATLSEADKKLLLEGYNAALEDLRSTRQRVATVQAFEEKIQQAPQRLEALRTEQNQPVTEPEAPKAPDDATLAQLEQRLAQEEANFKAAKDQVDAIDKEQSFRATRRKDLPQEVAQTRQELDELNRQLATENGAKAEMAPAVARMNLVKRLARQQRLEQRRVSLDKELQAYDATREALSIERDLAARKVTQAEKSVQAWQRVVNARRQQEADQAQRMAEEARREAAGKHEIARRVADQNAQLAEARTRLVDDLKKATDTNNLLTKRLDGLKREFTTIESKVDKGGLTKDMGLLLRRLRTRLPQTTLHRRDVVRREEEISKVSVDEFEYTHQRNQLADIDETAAELLRGLDPSIALPERADLEAVIRTLLQNQRDNLDALRDESNTYLSELTKLNETERALIQEVETYRSYIDERVLWIRSTALPRWADFTDVRQALDWLATPVHWKEAWRDAANQILTHPVISLFWMSAILLSLVFRPRIRSRLKTVGQNAAKSYTYVLGPTLEAFGLTLLLTLPIPLGLGGMGWVLSSDYRASSFSLSIGAGLNRAAILLVVIQVIHQTCRPHGLGELHFNWPAPALHNLQRLLRLSSPFLVSFMALISVLELLPEFKEDSSREVEWQNSLGRLAFIGFQLGGLILSYFVVRPGKGVLSQWLDARPALSRTRYETAGFILGFLLPAVLTGVAVIGYYYTALQLVERLLEALVLVLGIILIRAFTLRWILMSRRRIAIELARQRRAAETQQAGGAPATSEVPLAAAESNLQNISEQTQNLVKAFLVVCLFLGLWWIWDDVFPALRVFNNITLWQSVETVSTPSSTSLVEEGAATPRVAEEVERVTLGDLLLAIGVVAMTLVLAGNVPGLMEIAILKQLKVPASKSHAITTITRYVITLIGFIIGFEILGIGWSKYQWLVAAISVGLGFGLQEIIANFVSGLIILFEQPLRVGDLVTISGVNGVVSRIRIRATTITDFDRREFLVPNKDFITGQLINWTLSDRVSRQVIPVGIAYGSDTQKAYDLLLKVARECEYVMKDPGPHVLFRGFGDNALNFELRVYLPNRDQWIEMMNYLHMHIDQAFRDAGIEISFPQRDIHVRSISAGPLTVNLKSDVAPPPPPPAPPEPGA